MTMNRDLIRETVFDSVRDKLLRRGIEEEVIESLDEDVNTADLGLTSLDGVDLACVWSKRLGCVIPSQINPIRDDVHNRMRSLNEIVDCLARLSSIEEGNQSAR